MERALLPLLASKRWPAGVRAWATRAAGLALVLVLSGCARSAGSVSVSNGWNFDGELGADGLLHYPDADYRDPGGGRRGGTLRATTAADVGTFDIHATSHGNIHWLGRLLFDCLVYQDTNGDISPWLANSWEVSDDGTVYTFHLRDGVSFSDGTPLDAEAVRVNLEHMRDPATKSPLAAAYIEPYDHGEVVDRLTFRATLKHPYTPFLDVLAQGWLGMISPKQILDDPKSIATRPVGSGPFVLESYVRDQRAVFVRRDDYGWAPPQVHHNGPAYLDRIELSFVTEPLVRYGLLASGDSDFTFDAPPQNAAAIRADPNLVLHNRIRKGNPSRAVIFNVEQFPFDDVRVRQALVLGTDRDGLARIVGFGEYVPKSDFLAANTRYYDPAFRKLLAYDPVEANRLLDEAGWSARDAEGFRTRDGVRLAAVLIMSDNPQTPASLAVALQSDAGKLGFQLRIEYLPTAVVSDRRRSGAFQAVTGGYWHTNTPDGLYVQYHRGAITTPKLIGQNAARLDDAQLNDLLDRARRETRPEQLRDLYRQAQQRLTVLVPAMPVYESHAISAFRKQVRGVYFDTSHNTPHLLGVWIGEARP